MKKLLFIGLLLSQIFVNQQVFAQEELLSYLKAVKKRYDVTVRQERIENKL